MHSSACELEQAGPRQDGAEVLVAIAALVSEGRTPAASQRGFSEGPHCPPSKASQGHVCNLDNALCIKYDKIRSYVLSLWQKSLPLCIDVLLVPKCCCENDLICNPSTSQEPIGSALLLEQWHVNVLHRRTHDFSSTNMNINQLMNALRSQLYFSQISAWLATPEEKIRTDFQDVCVVYCLTVPGETYGCATFASSAQHHTFPSADLAGGIVLRVSLSSLPRSEQIPLLKCSKCDVPRPLPHSMDHHCISVLDDRMQTSCTLKGKHRCEDLDDIIASTSTSKSKLQLTEAESKCDINKCCERGQQLDGKVDLELSRKEFVEVLTVLRQSGPMKPSQNTKNKHDLAKQSKGDILLDAILRSSKVQEDAKCEESLLYDKMLMDDEGGGGSGMNKRKCGMKPPHLTNGVDGCEKHGMRVSDNMCDNKNDSINSDNRRIGGNDHIYIDINCDNIKRKKTDYIKMCDISNVFSLEYLEKRQKVKVKQKITFDEENVSCIGDKCNNSNGNRDVTNEAANNREESSLNKEFHALGIPSALEQAKFRKSLDSAASMVFHSRTGLPLTSSPAPVRRGKSCFDFDSSINSVSAIRSALFSLASCSTDEDSESDCSIVSPCSPDATNGLKQRESPPISYKHRGQSSGLLGSFVESVLNGRLEPVSTVHGFSAELGASGSFCPRHVVLPVTVFFYTLGDNDKVSTPYLGHINLGKKGYNVPKSGTIQVTLFNPLGTVVKMFVIMYDLSDMPPNSQTFIRQRTLFMPANCEDKNLEWSQKWLRYLIHLRFMSSKSGRIYLHSDIRMIICRKSDLDTATAHGIDMSYELRSFINSPTNPRFSPRK